jgi:hypothetical protein
MARHREYPCNGHWHMENLDRPGACVCVILIVWGRVWCLCVIVIVGAGCTAEAAQQRWIAHETDVASTIICRVAASLSPHGIWSSSLASRGGFSDENPSTFTVRKVGMQTIGMHVYLKQKP